MSKRWISIFVLLAFFATTISMTFLCGCETEGQTGALIGTAAGAGIGALAGGRHNAGTGALIGGAVGGGAGYIIGNEGDKKKTQAQMNAIQAEQNVVTVNINNSNGSITPVRLVRQGVVYIGPRGETYPTMPTQEQLKPVYGF
jgi:hypothetical protein